VNIHWLTPCDMKGTLWLEPFKLLPGSLVARFNELLVFIKIQESIGLHRHLIIMSVQRQVSFRR
jgi:hypothetical protein